MSDSFETPWTIAHQAPFSMGFPRQEYWSGFPFPSPGDLPNPGIKLTSPAFDKQILYHWATREAPWELNLLVLPKRQCIFVLFKYKEFIEIWSHLYKYRISQMQRLWMTLIQCHREEPVGYSLWGHRRSDTTEQLNNKQHISYWSN